MLVHLHIGLDKAGSTAIQHHLKPNRRWFSQHGIYIPETGLVQTGHRDLFRKMLPDDPAQLQAESDQARAAGFEQFLISWEGIHALPQTDLRVLRDLFAGARFNILVYLREQAEIIQSGYLQRLKIHEGEPAIASVRQLSDFLFQARRNYLHVLSRFAEVFGGSALQVRVYDKQLMPGGDVVADFLAALHLRRDAEFTSSRQASNASLDVPAAILVNRIDAGEYRVAMEREGVVDVLLEAIAAGGSADKYFLTQEEVESVQRHFQPANRQVVETYLGAGWQFPNLFPYRNTPFASLSVAETEQAVAARRVLIESLGDLFSWDGRKLQGDSLGRILDSTGGWQRSPTGYQPIQPGRAAIRFRIFRKHVMSFHRGLLLTLEHSGVNEDCGYLLSANGVTLGQLGLSTTELRIPLDLLQGFSELVIRILAPDGEEPGGAHADDHGIAITSMRFMLLTQRAP
jgi:hypothetical protein